MRDFAWVIGGGIVGTAVACAIGYVVPMSEVTGMMLGGSLCLAGEVCGWAWVLRGAT